MITLRAAIASAPVPTDEAEKAREMAVQTAREVADQRRERIEAATGDRLLLTMLLIGTAIGAVVMVGFPLLIGFSADVRHIASLVVLAAILTFIMYFATELDHPFSGLIKVEPDMFRTALIEYQRIP
jgi:predicted NAD/FAD-dependent oxidoreductase